MGIAGRGPFSFRGSFARQRRHRHRRPSPDACTGLAPGTVRSFFCYIKTVNLLSLCRTNIVHHTVIRHKSDAHISSTQHTVQQLINQPYNHTTDTIAQSQQSYQHICHSSIHSVQHNPTHFTFVYQSNLSDLLHNCCNCHRLYVCSHITAFCSLQQSSMSCSIPTSRVISCRRDVTIRSTDTSAIGL